MITQKQIDEARLIAEKAIRPVSLTQASAFHFYFKPEFCLELLKELEEAKKVIEYYAKDGAYYNDDKEWQKNENEVWSGKRAREYLSKRNGK